MIRSHSRESHQGRDIEACLRESLRNQRGPQELPQVAPSEGCCYMISLVLREGNQRGIRIQEMEINVAVTV